ncbi:Spastin [Diplonema papillatum]|nr:Spastin [Diplonema papillatum]
MGCIQTTPRKAGDDAAAKKKATDARLQQRIAAHCPPAAPAPARVHFRGDEEEEEPAELTETAWDRLHKGLPTGHTNPAAAAPTARQRQSGTPHQTPAAKVSPPLCSGARPPAEAGSAGKPGNKPPADTLADTPRGDPQAPAQKLGKPPWRDCTEADDPNDASGTGAAKGLSATVVRKVSRTQNKGAKKAGLDASGRHPGKPAKKAPPQTAASNGGGRAGKTKRGGAVAGDREELADLTEMERTIAAEIVDRSPSVTFDSIAGLTRVKDALHEIVIAPAINPGLFTGLRTPVKGVLLFGPPGNGKTLLAKAVATECKATFFNISASSITSKHYGESEKMVRTLFELARKMQPCVIFIDEVDSMLTRRGSSEHEASRRLKTEVLVQMDGLQTSHTERLVVLGATNRPWELDEAVLRRMPKRIYIPLPDKDTRRGLIARKLSQEKADVAVDDVVKMTEGHSGSDLAALCSEAAMNPLRELSRDKLATADPSAVRPINLQDFKKATTVIRPSVDPATLKQCLEWSQKYGML